MRVAIVFSREVTDITPGNIQELVKQFEALRGPKVPRLAKGNCLIFSLLFWAKNPFKCKIKVSWNSKRNVPSFAPVMAGYLYSYRPRDQGKPFTFIFDGIVHKIKINN